MFYSWVSEALDFTQMVMDIRKQLKITIFIIPNNFCFNNIAKKSFPGTHQGPALLLGVRGSGLLETTENDYFHHTQQLLLQQHCQKVISWDCPWSGSTPCSPRCLDFAQMVIDIRNNLKQLLSSFPTTFASTTLPKSYYL